MTDKVYPQYLVENQWYLCLHNERYWISKFIWQKGHLYWFMGLNHVPMSYNELDLSRCVCLVSEGFQEFAELFGSSAAYYFGS